LKINETGETRSREQEVAALQNDTQKVLSEITPTSDKKGHRDDATFTS